MFVRTVVPLLVLASIIRATVASLTPDPPSSGSCVTALDCQLNGVCASGFCACDAAWMGGNCSVLSLMPAVPGDGYGELGSQTSSWGAGVVYDESTATYWMFNDEINNHCGLQTWSHNSRCVLSSSSTPQGPYTKQQVVVSSWCHGSSVARDPVSGRFVFNHMASGNEPATTCTQCTTGVTPTDATNGPCNGPAGAANYTTAALVATSPLGPYTAAPRFPNGGNCETFIAPNGTVYVACPWGGAGPDPVACPQAAFLSVQTAPSLDAALAGNWTHLPLSYSLAGSNSTEPVCVNWEDQNIWMDSRGGLHTLMHAFRGQNTSVPMPGCRQGANGQWMPVGFTALGGHAYSLDGAHWYISSVPAYTPVVQYAGGNGTITFRARERPHVLLSPAGELSVFLSAVGDPGPGGNTGIPGADHTFTLAQGFTAAP